MLDSLDSRAVLRSLGVGTTIRTLCDVQGWSRPEFDAWWANECAIRAQMPRGSFEAAVGERVEIRRDGLGIPHVFAGSDVDLFLGFGLAMAEDRLFQMDYTRRRATGRLAEILGREALDEDRLVRTVGLELAARVEFSHFSEDTVQLLDAFATGVNLAIDRCASDLPIEFALLDYEPEPWTPLDCATTACAWAWYLTGRLPGLAVLELVKRRLDPGLYAAFVGSAEADDESSLPPGHYEPAREPAGSRGSAMSLPGQGGGSNSWVISGRRSSSGRPALASDPHFVFHSGIQRCMYEICLRGGAYDVAGACFVGMPAVLIGRNPHLAWGITNNPCSQRDLFREPQSHDHPGAFLDDGRWVPGECREETINVRGGDAVRLQIRRTPRGPVVNEVLPSYAPRTEPIALSWVGASGCGFLPSLLRLNRAESVDAANTAINEWLVPTLNLVLADGEGHIGYRVVGALPLREVSERGYRWAHDPKHDWHGLISADCLPRADDPARGWLATANNRPAPVDFPYDLSGMWDESLRARRIRALIEDPDRLDVGDFARMQEDVRSLRATACVEPVCTLLGPVLDRAAQAALGRLGRWNGDLAVASVEGALFETFFRHWVLAVVAERLPRDEASIAAAAGSSLASRLLCDDDIGWFSGEERRRECMRAAFQTGLSELKGRLGPELDRWTWGAIHQLWLRHVLSHRGDLSQLLDLGPRPIGGSLVTLCNYHADDRGEVVMGATYRMIVDFGSDPPAILAKDLQGQSGLPGSKHYGDQFAEWSGGPYHSLALVDAADVPSENILVLKPAHAV